MIMMAMLMISILIGECKWRGSPPGCCPTQQTSDLISFALLIIIMIFMILMIIMIIAMIMTIMIIIIIGRGC